LREEQIENRNLFGRAPNPALQVPGRGILGALSTISTATAETKKDVADIKADVAELRAGMGEVQRAVGLKNSLPPKVSSGKTRAIAASKYAAVGIVCATIVEVVRALVPLLGG
jgi:hypothetical protein